MMMLEARVGRCAEDMDEELPGVYRYLIRHYWNQAAFNLQLLTLVTRHPSLAARIDLRLGFSAFHEADVGSPVHKRFWGRQSATFPSTFG